jgi:hypothetical protein
VPNKQDKKNEKQKKDSSAMENFILFAVLAASFFAAKYFGSWPSGDFITHLTAIRKLMELPQILFTNYHVREYTVSPYGHNIWYLFYCSITRVAHVDPIETWALLAMVLTPLTLMAFYLFAFKLFQNKTLALISMLVFVFHYGVMNNVIEGGMSPYWGLSGVVAYPSRVSLYIVLPVLLYYIFSYLYSDNKKYLYIVSLCSLVIVFTHFYYFLCVLFMCGSFFVISFIIRSEDAKLSLKLGFVICAILVPSAFYVGWFVRSLFPTLNPIFKGLLYGHFMPIIMIKNKYPIVNPLTGLVQNNLRWAAYICVPFLLYFTKKNIWALFIFSVSAMTAFIFFNPLALYILKEFNPSLDRIYLLTEIAPYELVLGFFIYYFFTVTIKKINSKILRDAVLYMSIFGIIFYSVKNIEKVALIPYTVDNTLEMLNSNRGFMQSINSVIPPGSTVFMDDGKIWFWSDFFPHYNVSHPNIAVLPNNVDPTKRRQDSQFFFKNPLEKRSFDILNEYKVDFVLIDKKYAENKDLVKYGSMFKPVFQSQGFTIYKFLGDWNKPV